MLKTTSKWWLTSLNFCVSSIRYVFLWKQYEELSGLYHCAYHCGLWLTRHRRIVHDPNNYPLVSSNMACRNIAQIMHHIPSELHLHLVRGKLPLLWANRRVGRHPIGSMYAIYGNICHQYIPNVSIYTIHGSYGHRNVRSSNSWRSLLGTSPWLHLARHCAEACGARAAGGVGGRRRWGEAVAAGGGGTEAMLGGSWAVVFFFSKPWLRFKNWG